VVHIEKINYPMLFKDGATPVEYWAGLQHDIAKGWLKYHESGNFVTLAPKGAGLFASSDSQFRPAALSYPQGHGSCVMSTWTPSIVPHGDDETVYLVTDDLGKLGSVWREADVETTDLETVITDLMTGQYHSPVRIVAFNTAERWSRDVSEDIAREIRRRFDLQLSDVSSSLQDFVERHESHRRQLALRLV